MDKKREEVYAGGIICLLFSILLSIFTGNLTINNAWNISTLTLWVLAGAFGVFGVGSLLKPDSFGVVVLRLMESYAKSQAERSNSHNQQTQKKSSGSVQVNASDEAEVHVSVSPREEKQAQKSTTEEVSRNSRIFCCPRGHKIAVYPPDDNHPKASSEEDYAKKYALGTVIPIKYTCEKEGCGSEFTLYWYQERIVGYFG